MPLVSVPALYDGNRIALLETPPSRKPYRVLVTFVEPVDAADVRERIAVRFLGSFGAWRDDRPVEATLADIHESRRSRTEPPAL
jgi:hypothetical protein